MTAFKKTEDFSNDRIRKIRDALGKKNFKHIGIIVVGSFGRKEASDHSDIDFYVVGEPIKEDSEKKLQVKEGIAARKIILSIVKNAPGAEGAFGTDDILNESNFLKNIGGNKDNNKEITRRILLLLEGDWLYNETMFLELRKKIIERYVNPKDITHHQLALFLLNDVIRLYRTMCVDFEYKTKELGKDWGLRNIKLAFSRKLLYFSGVISIAETAQKIGEDKVSILVDLFSKPPVKRISEVCGLSAEKPLNTYKYFLEMMESSDIRKELKLIKKGEKHNCSNYGRLKNKSHHFSWELLNLLKQNFNDGHPIHKCLIL